MAKIRYIHTKFWSDNFVREHLNPLDRYLFLYFLTNEKTNICGIYELPLSTMASETGLDKEMLEKMLKRLEGKVDYHDGWVIIRNFIKHQKTGSKDFDLGVKRVYEKEIPLKIRVYTEKTTPSIDPLATLSPHTALPVPVPVPIPILVPVLEREESAEAPTPKELAEAFFDRGSTYSKDFGFIFGGARQRFQATRLCSAGRGIAGTSASAVVAGKQFADCQVLVSKNQVALQEVIQLTKIAGPGMILAGLQQRR